MAGIRLHPRTLTVESAQNELRHRVNDIITDRDLTWTEAAIILGELQSIALKYALRAERHPDDPERKADEE